MNDKPIGSMVVVQHDGERKIARVIRKFTVEEIWRSEDRITVVTPDGVIMCRPATECAVAADQRVHTAELMARAAAYLMELDWYPHLEEGPADLMASVFLDLWCNDSAEEEKSMLVTALLRDTILRRALAEHRTYQPSSRIV
ncbi:hypothetical protein AB0A05_26825 [Streptomyces sp. NPDC046374]|uniref:hypothetical protein n=1 Tax=Streptomyces sp. NPDC046374 TaxID=3154917 RepID=UPI0033E4FBB3